MLYQMRGFIFLLTLLWLFDSYSSQFTNVEIRNLRRRAKDAGFSNADMISLESQIADSVNIRYELDMIKKNEPHEITKINDMSSLLRDKFRELIAKTNPVFNQKGTSAAERAIERLKIRRSLKAAEEEKQRMEREQLNYVANTKKLKLVDESIRVLRARGVTYELKSEG